MNWNIYMKAVLHIVIQSLFEVVLLYTFYANRLLHRKCDVRIFIHSLQDFGKLTRSLRSLVNKNPYKALSVL